MEKLKFSKPVAFNRKNEKDRIMLKHVKKRNFSGYVKKLIWDDISKKYKGEIREECTKEVTSTKQEKLNQLPNKSSKVSAAARIEQLKQQTKKQQPSSSPLPVLLTNKNINK